MIWLASLATLCLGIDLGWRWGCSHHRTLADVVTELDDKAYAEGWDALTEHERHIAEALGMSRPLDVVDMTDFDRIDSPADIRWSR